MIRFRCGTYNVHKCKGTDWRVSAPRIAAVICELKTDVLAVQEILLSQAAAISEQTKIPFTFGPAREHASEPYGNAVFTTFPVQSSTNYDVSVPARESRSCLQVSLALADAVPPIQFYAVHLGTSFLERREQARRMEQLLAGGGATGRRIVAGDFNEWTRGLATRTLATCMQSADITMHLHRTRTYPGLLPFLHLDHIYYDPPLRLVGMHLHRTRLALLASDHLPLLADFEC